MAPERSRLDMRSGASDNSAMESRASRLGFSLDALIGEAKRRARQRRVLVLLLLLVIAGATAAVVLRPSGGGSRGPSSLSGRAGGTLATSHSLHFGAFALTVPKGFRQYEAQDGSRGSLEAFWVAHHPRAAATTQSATGFPASQVFLWVQAHTGTPSMAQRLPLDLHKLHRSPPGGFARDGTAWLGVFYGGHDGYLVTVFEGSKASAADRAAIERALRSIRRAS
jgi:hypothetical protein